MNDPFRIDSHKLHLHPQRVTEWMEGKIIAPLYIEVSPSGACNHRCVFCGKDFMGYVPRFLPKEIFSRRLAEMGAYGVKSIMFAGEGEPLLHKNITDLAEATKQAGMDVAFTTNAVLLKLALAEKLLPVSSWIKVSCNAGTPQTYAKIHGTQAADFEKVMANMAAAANVRAQNTLACTLGFQMVLLPENMDEAVTLAQRARDLGADYLVIKPYSQHPQGLSRKYESMRYENMHTLAAALHACTTDNFRVIFRHQTMQRQETATKGYAQCLALPFWSYIDATGHVWGCSMFLQSETFDYGSLLDHSFKEIWEGKLRQDHLAWAANHLDASHCRLNCRMDAINSYLWELTHPEPHVNFI